MDIYKRFILKHQGEYIYARICWKIAEVLNESHKGEGYKPDYVISQGIEFTTKGKECLKLYNKDLWKEAISIATEEYRLLSEDEKEACMTYIYDLDDSILPDTEIIHDICSEFETYLERWAFDYVEEELRNGRMSKKEGDKILYANTRGDSPFPFIDDEDDDWDEEEDIDDIWDEFERLRDELDNENQDDELPFSGKSKVVKPKYCS